MFTEKQHLNRTIRKVLGGVSFVNISLVSFFFIGQCIIFFLGFLSSLVHEFVLLNFPALHD